MKIVKDHTVENHYFRRLIEVEDGPVVKQKYHNHKVPFQVTHLSLVWDEGEEPHSVIAYGKSTELAHVKCRKSYNITHLPKWVSELLAGSKEKINA